MGAVRHNTLPSRAYSFAHAAPCVVICAWVWEAETFGFPLRTPGLRWQVPERWLQGRSEGMRTMIWGMTLGPGWVTINPYAGIWLLPLLAGMGENLLMAGVVSGVAGAIHGGARAIGVLSNSKRIAANCSHLMILGQQFRWRRRDGFILLLVAGTLAAYLLTLLGLK